MRFTEYPITEISSKKFPAALHDLKKRMPQKLFVRGTFDESLFEKAIAVVGSRKVTRYGREAMDMVLPDIISAGYTVVSGFMYGVDTYAHEKTIEYGGVTIAVLGSGLNTCYPSENEQLYVDIIESGGAVVSEYESNAKTHVWKFPQRNRIVAALSTKGVLVVEAGERSGSLGTAALAESLKRPLYAFPGPITSSVSQGTNILIKERRARLVTSVGDIIEKANESKNKKVKTNSSLESQVLDFLLSEPLSVDELSLKLNKNIGTITTIITTLSLSGQIREEGGRYSVSR